MHNRTTKKIAITLMISMLVGVAFPGYSMEVKASATKASVTAQSEDADGQGTEQEAYTDESTEEETTVTDECEQGVTEETTGSDEKITAEEETGDATTEETTTEVEYEILQGVYKVQGGVLIEYLGDKDDSSVASLQIPKKITKINDRVFQGYKYIEDIEFAEGSKLTEIGEYAFYKCTALTRIEFPTGLTTIGYRALYKCTSLKSLTIPSTVTSGDRILGSTASVTKVTFAKGMVTIPDNILKNAKGVITIKLKSGVTTIGAKAFMNCTALTSVTFPSTVTTIKKSAFNGCTSLATVYMSKNTKTIKSYAFKDCTALKELTLKKTVKEIGTGAFDGDTNLTLLVYANSTAKAYARKNNINWDYTQSEKDRQAKSTSIYNKYKSLLQSKSSKYKLKNLKNYVPQGVCVIGDYLVVSMYYKNLSKNSILLIYNKNTGKYIKKLVLPLKDHVGSVTNVEGRLVIGLNNVSTTDSLAVISEKRLKKTKNGKTVKYNYVKKISGHADFASYDGKYFWAGHSANLSSARMYGYKVKITKKNKLTFTKKYSYVVPKNTQGLIVKKEKGGKRTFIFTQSYGRLNDSSLITYSININKKTSLGSAESTKSLPAMAEGICTTSDGYVFIVFESASGLYCSNVDNTSEIQIKNIGKLKYSDLSNLS